MVRSVLLAAFRGMGQPVRLVMVRPMTSAVVIVILGALIQANFALKVKGQCG